MFGNDLDQGLALMAVSILVMFALPFVMAWLEESLADPPRASRARPTSDAGGAAGAPHSAPVVATTPAAEPAAIEAATPPAA